ncbi:helix-turn-helix domain-containing protein [Bradyrhizobium sp.]|uniref:helix-turn-helix domain-containing protein n=1 Tax=Bradyrhizobium TaxID=374 RepID=UPI003451320B
MLLKEGSARPQPRANSTSPTIVAKWVTRFRTEGVDGLRDRSSRPHSLPGQTPAATCATVEALRRQRHTGRQIAAEIGISPATVSRILRRLGLNRWPRWSRPSRSAAMSASTPASLSTSTSRSSAGSALWDIASPGGIPARSIATMASAGSSSMSASTMLHASPSCR